MGGIIERVSHLINQSKTEKPFDYEALAKCKAEADRIRTSNPESNLNVYWVYINKNLAIRTSKGLLDVVVDLEEAGYVFDVHKALGEQVIEHLSDISSKVKSPIVTDFDIPYIKMLRELDKLKGIN